MSIHAIINSRSETAAATAAMIERYQHNGILYLEESGMDCDCVQYAGLIHEIPACIFALEMLDRRLAEWSDGPYSLIPLRFEDVQEIRYVMRDLALEAFEDGHQHVVYPFFREIAQ